MGPFAFMSPVNASLSLLSKHCSAIGRLATCVTEQLNTLANKVACRFVHQEQGDLGDKKYHARHQLFFIKLTSPSQNLHLHSPISEEKKKRDVLCSGRSPIRM